MTQFSERTFDDSENPRTLIDELLDEQQRLTVVERFARKHDRGAVPAQARYYQDLIPPSKPGPGQQYAFAVDLDACTGCKACVSACHSLNGLEEDEMWRNCGLLHGGTESEPYRQTVTTACHHCVEPACLEGCPVMAYDKDAETGIVRHLDDQCIGCQYCVLKCPYDVPKYSERLGIVRKCDMCIGRLQAGEAPACVQACPHEAITIELVDRAQIVGQATPGKEMLPGAFDSSYTKPTTRFFSEHPLPADAEAGDEASLRLERAHWPLVWMLLLTQMSAGLFLALGVEMVSASDAISARALGSTAWVVLQLGLAVSVLHLGRPLGAWRFFLGLRTSWMSREILVFSLFAALGSATLGALWLPLAPIPSRLEFLHPLIAKVEALTPMLAGLTALIGLAGVFTSVMIYVDTRRSFWSISLTAPKFFGTTLLLGSITAALILATMGAQAASALAFAAAAAIRVGLFLWDVARQIKPAPRHTLAVRRASQTVERYLPWVPKVHLSLFAVFLLACAVAIVTPRPMAIAAMVVMLVAAFSSVLLERFCFFVTCPAPRMPGGVTA
ncbi:MAG TPA: DmsC/YnfH family molybdoenzyme membrane anchor subunit [Chthoniobacter sp.]|jgi:Fe-S-cluster-containing dehydrogenase component/DMSO reductase anchor subunit